MLCLLFSTPQLDPANRFGSPWRKKTYQPRRAEFNGEPYKAANNPKQIQIAFQEFGVAGQIVAGQNSASVGGAGVNLAGDIWPAEPFAGYSEEKGRRRPDRRRPEFGLRGRGGGKSGRRHLAGGAIGWVF